MNEIKLKEYRFVLAIVTGTVLGIMFLPAMIVAQEQQERQREAWVKKLTSAPESSRWFVGANFGKELSALPEDQALEILEACWDKIADSVRPQILKGLKPAFKKTDGINDRTFNILHMAYHDPDETVQQFAKSYINALTFSVDAENKSAYRRWYLANKNKTATEVIVNETTEFANSLSGLAGGDIGKAVDQIADAANDMREFSAMRDAAAKAGMMDTINKWVESKKLRTGDPRLKMITQNIMKGSKVASAAAAAPTEEFAGFAQKDLKADGNDKMRYFLMTRDPVPAAPADGFKLVLILPGGSGSADFNSFCRRIHMNALPDDYVVAELVAPVWDAEQRVVWPSKNLNPDDASFTTEKFINAVVEDASKQLKIDKRYVFTLGWSSGGPPIYSAALQKDTPVTGTFVAMSVFKPNLLPDLKAAKDKPFYLLQSQQDQITAYRFAQAAEKQLADGGGTVKLQSYRGGHGWREDPYGHIRRGIEWLEDKAKK